MTNSDRRDRQTLPIFDERQKLKLGLFSFNVSGGMMATTAPTSFEVSWAHTKKIALQAERMGFEALVPVARWRGFEGKTNFAGESFETYTWAAGLAEATERIMVFATSHVPTVHPVLAAKQAVTIDHISNGRFGLNVVMGWFTHEMEMFGGKQKEHDSATNTASNGSRSSSGSGRKRGPSTSTVVSSGCEASVPCRSRSRNPTRCSSTPGVLPPASTSRREWSTSALSAWAPSRWVRRPRARSANGRASTAGRYRR
jgi:hypothetical protein